MLGSLANGAYKLSKTQLGSGGEAIVVYGTHVATGTPVAVKITDKTTKRLRGRPERVYVEARALANISHHPNILSVLHTEDTDTHFYMVTEYCGGGDMARHLNRTGAVTDEQARTYFTQLWAAVAHIHAQGYCHRDIKLENVLLASDGTLRLCDFGYACPCTADEMLDKVCGTPQYVAPEVIKQQAYNGQRSDAWSLGVLLYAMVAGRFPFLSSTGAKRDLFEAIKRAEYTVPRAASVRLRATLAHLLHKDPERRLTVDRLARNTWMVHGAYGHDYRQAVLLCRTAASSINVLQGVGDHEDDEDDDVDVDATSPSALEPRMKRRIVVPRRCASSYLPSRTRVPWLPAASLDALPAESQPCSPAAMDVHDDEVNGEDTVDMASSQRGGGAWVQLAAPMQRDAAGTVPMPHRAHRAIM